MMNQKLKTAVIGFSAFCAALFAAEAGALGCTNGTSNTSTLTLHGPDLDVVGNMYLNKFYTDSEFVIPVVDANQLTECQMPVNPGPHTTPYSNANILCNDSPPTGGTNYAAYLATANASSALGYDDANSNWIKTLPVVCSTATTYQSGNTVTSISYTSGTTVNSGSVIGLAGALKVRSSNTNNPYSPSRSIRHFKLSLSKSGSTWYISDAYGTLFELSGVTETVSGSGGTRHLTLSATGVAFTNSTDWGAFYDGALMYNHSTSTVTATQLNQDLGGFTATVYF
ncbi:hypothetical protein HC024_15675 [Methylococcaceae bacterium WWC4]|nr:hypothetical protein [Methylococcaceae bacterium WWC4]